MGFVVGGRHIRGLKGQADAKNRQRGFRPLTKLAEAVNLSADNVNVSEKWQGSPKKGIVAGLGKGFSPCRAS